MENDIILTVICALWCHCTSGRLLGSCAHPVRFGSVRLLALSSSWRLLPIPSTIKSEWMNEWASKRMSVDDYENRFYCITRIFIILRFVCFGSVSCLHNLSCVCNIHIAQCNQVAGLSLSLSLSLARHRSFLCAAAAIYSFALFCFLFNY